MNHADQIERCERHTRACCLVRLPVTTPYSGPDRRQAMPQTITKGFREMLEEAEREREREGKIPGAFSCTRGMLEFWIDPASPYHKPVFAEDKKFVFFCAGGWRSALAAQTAQRMGLKPVAHIKGGFSEWKKSGAPVEMPEPKKA